MKRLLNLIERNVEKNMIPRLIYITDFNKKEYARDIYIDGNVYVENKMDLVFLIDTGDWFLKTIRFDIEVNTKNNLIKVRKGYGEDYNYFEKNEYKKVEDFILSEIIKFYLNNSKSNKDIKEKIKDKKII